MLVVQRSLGTLGRKDLRRPETIDGLIGHLQKLASPNGRRGLRVGEMRMLGRTTAYGSPDPRQIFVLQRTSASDYEHSFGGLKNRRVRHSL